MKRVRRLREARLLVLLIVLFVGCAKDLPPPGGPADTTPPQILSSSPLDGDTLVAVDGNIRILFSERTQAKSAQNALFISPPLKAEPRIKVKGDWLIIDPEVDLEAEKTYVVSLGASLTDINGNRMTNSLAFAFSTGSHIDSATVRGTVFDQMKPVQNFRVFAFRKEPWLQDSLFALIPDYLTESGADGRFEFKYMRPGEYLVIGVEDKDRDNKISSQSERVALPSRFATAAKITESSDDYSLFVSRYDSLNFALANCRGVAGAITMQFTGGKLDVASVSADSVLITGSDGAAFNPQLAVAFEQESDKLHIWSERLVRDTSYHVLVKGLRSLEGRHLEGDTASYTLRLREPDSDKPAVLARQPAADRLLMLPPETLSVTYTEPVRIQNGAAKIVVDSTLSIAATAMPGKATEYFFLPQDTLPANRRLKFVLENRLVSDLFGNSPVDSLYQFDFMVTSPESLGIFTGSIETRDTVTLVLQGITRKMKYTFSQGGTGHFRWQLYPDAYTLYAYNDRNHNQRWDLGTLIPLTFAERGWVVQDTIKVRARFEYEGFDLILK